MASESATVSLRRIENYKPPATTALGFNFTNYNKKVINSQARISGLTVWHTRQSRAKEGRQGQTKHNSFT